MICQNINARIVLLVIVVLGVELSVCLLNGVVNNGIGMLGYVSIAAFLLCLANRLVQHIIMRFMSGIEENKMVFVIAVSLLNLVLQLVLFVGSRKGIDGYR